MDEKTTTASEPEVDTQATRNPTLAPQCPPVGTNQTFSLVRRRRVRYQRKQTYHYHHAP
jgi:hypothetical protein